jgi:hypothetical protein
MTIHVELGPDVEAGLAAQAKARGVSLEAYVQQVLRDRSAAIGLSQGGPKERARLFEAWARDHPHTPPLSDEAIKRENLVRDGR